MILHLLRNKDIPSPARFFQRIIMDDEKGEKKGSTEIDPNNLANGGKICRYFTRNEFYVNILLKYI